MEHNLDDSLAMDSIENMDFEHAGDSIEVAQEDISLEVHSQEDNIPMDMDAIEEQPILLEEGNEEVIISDFIGDQFGFQEYSVHTENTSGANVTIDANQLGQTEMTGQSEQMVDIQYAETSKPAMSQPSLITIKAIPQRSTAKKTTVTAPYPRQVAIAPKPIKGAPNVHYAIAPKPVAIMVNKNAGGTKTVPMKSIVQGIKGNTVLAQIGKQLVMVPASAAGQKLKLVSGASGDNIQLVRCNPDSAQLIANKGAKNVRTKFVLQGQSSAESSSQPAVITKLAAPKYIMQQKTVPITIGGNKVVITTPTKQPVKVTPKKQIISIKADSSTKVVTSQANMQTKKVVITANPATSQAKVVTQTQGQRTHLHPINVPGKGIQYIKLVTNQPAAQKAAPKTQPLSISGKNFVLTDSKGNIIQMGSDKVLSTQPPPLLVTGTSTVAGQVTTKGRKFVRIAPVSSKSDTSTAKVREVTKMAYCLEPKPARAAHSLLAPRSPPASAALEDFSMIDQNLAMPLEDAAEENQEEDAEQEVAEEKVVDIKPTLASLVSDAVRDEPELGPQVEIEISPAPAKHEYYQDESRSSMEQESEQTQEENLIIVPSNMTHDADDSQVYRDDSSVGDSRLQTVVSVEADVLPYLSPQVEQAYSDSVMFEGGPAGGALRPRKACNCTKSQCLKLYCDCFANGEFCNQCNCNNCFNNLDHEDTRQKAIRACLERNPNAFRPKIGKSKSGGPDIVRRHNKGCNCKRSGCLKNYCECYEAKIACTLMCKCVGCRNIEETLERRRDALRLRDKLADPAYRAPLPSGQVKQPCNFLTCEVIEAVAQCMLAVAGEDAAPTADPVEDVLLEFSRCMADIISAAHHAL